MSRRRWLLLGLGIAALIVALLAPFASEDPDTLERTLAAGGVGDEVTPVAPAPMPEYQVPVLGRGWGSTIAAGLLGVLAVVALLYGVVRPRRRPQA